MTRRQTSMPERWLIVDAQAPGELRRARRALPRGSGILVLAGSRSRHEQIGVARQLRRACAAKRVAVVCEHPGKAARVHNPTELRRALLKRTELILLSPLYPTRSHPDWKPLPRMRAAALARLAGRRLIALGGMDQRRFRRVQRLGFQGWAGISAWIRT